MAHSMLVVLLAITLVSRALAVSSDFNDKLIAQNIQLDAGWVDNNAHHKLDIVVVLDESGSVGVDDFFKAKVWIRSFLEFFSISPQYTQVGLVTFGTKAEIKIQMNTGTDKCSYLKALDKMKYNGGATNMGDGLRLAEMMFLQQGRPDVAIKLVVLISDGWFTAGPQPLQIQQSIRRRYPKSHFMVVAIGRANDYTNDFAALATSDSRGQKMIFAVKSFTAFANVAHYFHKGNQGSQLSATSSSNCANPSCDGRSKSFCACDSLGRGVYQCACEPGKYAVRSGNLDVCQACTLGGYMDRKSVRRSCKQCGDPAKETTTRTGSTSSAECVCAVGFANTMNPGSRQTPCSTIRCPAAAPQQLNNLNTALVGSCQTTYKSRCTYKCAYGYSASAQSMSRECKINGQWSHALPQCTAVRCPVLTTVPSAAPWKCKARSGLQGNQVGTVCMSACNTGYVPKHDTSVQRACKGDGSWSGANLQCIARTCTTLPAVVNGGYQISQCSSDSSRLSFGTQCQVTCNRGYKLHTGATATYTCTKSGNWDKPYVDVQCLDIQPPVVSCAALKHEYLVNDENMGYGSLKLSAPAATDNSNKKPKLEVSINTPDDTIDIVNFNEDFLFPIGTSQVKYTYTDAAGNSASCGFEVTVKDVQAPNVVSCDGPRTNESYIFTTESSAFVTWPQPTFSDNSEKAPKVYSSSTPGDYSLGTYKITYTATDDFGNTATCAFEFTVTSTPCPPLHVPYNGALVCDKVTFGTVCVPHCNKGLQPLYPVDIRQRATKYLCSLSGVWSPRHAYVPDCAIRTEIDDGLVLSFDGDCNDEVAVSNIQQSTFNQLESTAVGRAFILQNHLGYEDFRVECGSKDETIVQEGARRKRSNEIEQESWNSEEFQRVKRNLNKAELDAFIKKLLANKKKPSDCVAGAEEQTENGKKYCFKCPPGTFYSWTTRKCTSCPVGTYSTKDATVGQCTPCTIGTSTAAVGAGNASLCVQQCPPGRYSNNGLMQPVNCKACALGTYGDRSGLKQCTRCPKDTTTSDVGANDKDDCQVQCPAGYYSHNGLAPCDRCPLNSYQPSVGLKVCLKCPVGKTTLHEGSSQLSQCLVIYECTSNPCRNGGTCVDGNNRFICNCAPGWTGDMCEIDIDECASKPCWSGATCVDRVNDFKCVCPHGFKGKVCNLNINECANSPCVNKGICIDTNGDFECSCPAGLGGKTCSLNQNDCTPGICWNGAKCIDKVNGFLCKCAKGFRGEQCAENINDCEHNGCRNGATCVDGTNSYKCRCMPGYTGSSCEVNIDECARSPCKRSGTCTDAINDYKCTCASYWGGKDCSKSLNTCFNLDMTPNTVEDYVVYDPAAKIPPISQITVRFSMKSNDLGLNAHYGTIISYGLLKRTEVFNIKTFPEHMLQVNGDQMLTGVDVTDGNWHTVCMTWRASDGRWIAYEGSTPSSLSMKSKATTEFLSKSRVIDGGGKFVIGQLDKGEGEEFSETSTFQGELNGLSIWYKWDQCNTKAAPNLAWPNLVYNGKAVTRTNKGMIKTGVRGGGRC